ncbi:16S rRNA (cytosine(1402)-N(4))-methyltransferase RsmH [Spiroplasma endosymbiont of Crioceris asparagi]|uniref:16S rRNA (cytosine(1402)-N(4))-methyltransferase RsmH n=1 Tax=Spiroplasma endosymbiont of Crioceris asparagi TaxID=3066286 RepID=UPI0030CB9B77
MEHISVLLDEATDLLNIKQGGVYVDATLGRAGHSQKILNSLTNGKLFCFDLDTEAIKKSEILLNKISKNYLIFNENYKNLKACLAMQNVFKVDGVLYDLGVSSPQLDDQNRGFSYRFNSRIDMRMNQTQKLDGHYVVNNLSEQELTNIFFKYGEEKYAKSIAKNIVKKRLEKPIDTTFELVEIIKSSIPKREMIKKHPAKKVFQAIRIYVNDELSSLETSLEDALQILNVGGRVVVITFHSLEENIVKKIFKKYTIFKEDEIINKLPITIENNKQFKLVMKKPFTPNLTEQETNKRSRTAKLWAIERIKE